MINHWQEVIELDEVLSNGAFDQMIEHGITDKSLGVYMSMVLR